MGGGRGGDGTGSEVLSQLGAGPEVRRGQMKNVTGSEVREKTEANWGRDRKLGSVWVEAEPEVGRRGKGGASSGRCLMTRDSKGAWSALWAWPNAAPFAGNVAPPLPPSPAPSHLLHQSQSPPPGWDNAIGRREISGGFLLVFFLVIFCVWGGEGRGRGGNRGGEIWGIFGSFRLFCFSSFFGFFVFVSLSEPE